MCYLLHPFTDRNASLTDKCIQHIQQSAKAKNAQKGNAIINWQQRYLAYKYIIMKKILLNKNGISKC